MEERFRYYTPKIKRFPVTRFAVIGNTFDKKQRRIQSEDTEKLHLKTIHSSEKMTSIHSNRQLYFLTLLSQYNEMRIYSQKEQKNINHCAGFHSSIIDHKNRFSVDKRKKRVFPKKNLHEKRLWDYDFVSLYPELFLPTISTGKAPLVIDLVRKKGVSSFPKIVQNALGVHLDKIYGELTELCESGFSENYYNYENLITISKMRSGFISSKENMKTLLKSTIFSNMALINSLKSSEDSRLKRRPSSITPNELYRDEVMKRLKVSWTLQYFERVDKRREKFPFGS